MGGEPPRFPYLQVDAPAPQQEALVVALFELGAAGVEVRDEQTAARAPAPDRVRLVASFARAEQAEAARRALAGGAELSCTTGTIVGDEWREAFKSTFAAFEIVPGLWVVPPWEAEPPATASRQLWMDPGRAFGTGLHATTRLVGRQLWQHAARYRGGVVLDAGTGSGLLALLALRLGARAARAIDTDPVAVEVARANAARNGLDARVVIDGTPLEAVPGRFAAVVANIRTEVLEALAAALVARIEPGGLLLLSGVLESEREQLLAAYRAAAAAAGVELALVETATEPSQSGGEEGWVALVLERGLAGAPAGGE